jgi:hypothetical protein
MFEPLHIKRSSRFTEEFIKVYHQRKINAIKSKSILDCTNFRKNGARKINISTRLKQKLK